MASNTQIVIEIIAMVVLIFALRSQVKALFLKEVNGYTIRKEKGLYTVYKSNIAKAQFIYERSAIEYCKTH